MTLSSTSTQSPRWVPVHSGVGNVWSQIQHLRGEAFCPRGVRKPCGVAGCGLETWRHVPMWRQGASWRRQMWRQNVASGSRLFMPLASPDSRGRCVTCTRGVAGRGVRTWRQAPSTYVASQDVASRGGVGRPRPPGTCLQNVSSVVGRYVHPTGNPLTYMYIYTHMHICIYIYIDIHIFT